MRIAISESDSVQFSGGQHGEGDDAEQGEPGKDSL